MIHRATQSRNLPRCAGRILAAAARSGRDAACLRLVSERSLPCRGRSVPRERERSMSESVTQLLGAWRAGSREALDQLTPLVYDELRRLARRYMSSERRGHTLQATELVNQAFRTPRRHGCAVAVIALTSSPSRPA